MTPSLQFLELNKKIHDRKSFDCGSSTLNSFLHKYASKHNDVGISKTFILPLQEDASKICAYYTLSHTVIKRQSLPLSLAKKLPHYPIPVMLIAQFAINKGIQEQGFEKITLIKALLHCYEINHHLPSFAVVVDALNEEVQHFYEQYDFKVIDISGHKSRLFLPMKTIKQLL